MLFLSLNLSQIFRLSHPLNPTPFLFISKNKHPTKLQETYAKKNLLQKHKIRNQNIKATD